MAKSPFIWEASDHALLTGQGGLGVVGQLLQSLSLETRLNATTVPGAEHPDITNRDVVVAYLGLLAQGQSDFDHIEMFREDPFFALALGIGMVPSSPTMRQRLDQAAAAESAVAWSAIMNHTSEELLRQHIHCQPIRIGARSYVPLDVDVSPFDNSKTQKEGVSRTYKGCDGFAPNFAYLGHEGYALGVEFRVGSQHCQKGTPAFLETSIERAQRILPEAQFLVRLDSGNDSSDNIDVCRAHHADFLIKRNLRHETPSAWLALAKAEGTAERPREGKIVYRGATERAPKVGHPPERIVYAVTERTITAAGQILLLPEIEVATYWTSLSDAPATILPWYPDHGTMEQYHSEFKTDMDLERLPSGKLATNNLIMQMALLMFNILRVIGQATLGDPAVPLRKSASRRRLRTVIQNLILCAAYLVHHARRYRVRYARTNPWGAVLTRLAVHFT